MHGAAGGPEPGLLAEKARLVVQAIEVVEEAGPVSVRLQRPVSDEY